MECGISSWWSKILKTYLPLMQTHSYQCLKFFLTFGQIGFDLKDVHKAFWLFHWSLEILIYSKARWHIEFKRQCSYEKSSEMQNLKSVCFLIGIAVLLKWKPL